MDAGEGRRVLDYKMTFSLKHLSSARIVVQLWSHKSIQDAVKRFLGSRVGYQPIVYAPELQLTKVKWGIVENSVFENASKLETPGAVCKLLFYLAKLIGVELFQWIRFMDDYVFDIRNNGGDKDVNYVYSICNALPSATSTAVQFLDSLVWTCMGQVDYKNTATNLLRSQNLDKYQKFKIACTFCCEEYVRAHFNQREIKKQSSKDMLVKYWVTEVSGKPGALNEDVQQHNEEYFCIYSPLQFVFHWALGRNNEAAARYLWDSHREELNFDLPNAVKNAGCVFNANFMCHLLSQADELSQQRAFDFTYTQILKCLLDNWDWGCYLYADHYLPTLRLVKDRMNPDDFVEPLQDVAKCLVDSRESYRCSYEEVFKELWGLCPKEYFLSNKDGIKVSSDILQSFEKSKKCENLVGIMKSDAKAFWFHKK